MNKNFLRTDDSESTNYVLCDNCARPILRNKAIRNKGKWYCSHDCKNLIRAVRPDDLIVLARVDL